MDIDHLHLYVGDARRWQDWFIHTLTLTPFTPGWVEGGGGVTDTNISLVLSDPQGSGQGVKNFLQRYSPGVGDVAFRVRDLAGTLQRAVQAGAKVTVPRQRWAQGWQCQIQGWGGLGHTLLQWDPASEAGGGSLAMGSHPPRGRSQAQSQSQPQSPLPWQAIDHAVLNVPAGDLDRAAAWYCQVLGFQPQQRFAIETPQSGLRSLVLQHPEGTATLPINEPTSANSQVQEFLDYHGGPGIQHVALRTGDLIQTLATVRQRGLACLPVPQTYYQELGDRPGFWREAADWAAIAQQQILVDWDPATPRSRLLQTFTQPLFDQPTFFLELIERQPDPYGVAGHPAQGFGAGNFQALFEAIERQQQQRGTL